MTIRLTMSLRGLTELLKSSSIRTLTPNQSTSGQPVAFSLNFWAKLSFSEATTSLTKSDVS